MKQLGLERKKPTPQNALVVLSHVNELKKLGINTRKLELPSHVVLVERDIKKSARKLSKKAAQDLIYYLEKFSPILTKVHAKEETDHFNMRHVGINGKNTGPGLVMVEGYLKTLISNAGIVYTQKNALKLYSELSSNDKSEDLAFQKRKEIESKYYDNILENLIRIPDQKAAPCLIPRQVVMAKGILVRLCGCNYSDTFQLEGLRYNTVQGNFAREIPGTYTTTHHGIMSTYEILQENPVISPNFHEVYTKGVDVINEDFRLPKEDSEHYLEV